MVYDSNYQFRYGFRVTISSAFDPLTIWMGKDNYLAKWMEISNIYDVASDLCANIPPRKYPNTHDFLKSFFFFFVQLHPESAVWIWVETFLNCTIRAEATSKSLLATNWKSTCFRFSLIRCLAFGCHVHERCSKRERPMFQFEIHENGMENHTISLLHPQTLPPM